MNIPMMYYTDILCMREMLASGHVYATGNCKNLHKCDKVSSFPKGHTSYSRDSLHLPKIIVPYIHLIAW